MNSSISTTPVRNRRRLIAVAAMALSMVLLSACLTEEGARSFDLINAERRAAGTHELANDFDLNARAQEWAEHLAAQGRLAHSSMEIPAGATRVAENVAYGPSVDVNHRNLMNSPGHRANILDSRMTRVGIGVATSASGSVFVVQLFAN